jgi:hypothetical protein
VKGTALPPNRALTIPAPTATSTRKKVPSSSEKRRRPSKLSSKKSNWATMEFGSPRERIPAPGGEDTIVWVVIRSSRSRSVLK